MKILSAQTIAIQYLKVELSDALETHKFRRARQISSMISALAKEAGLELANETKRRAA